MFVDCFSVHLEQDSVFDRGRKKNRTISNGNIGTETVKCFVLNYENEASYFLKPSMGSVYVSVYFLVCAIVSLLLYKFLTMSI